MMTTAQLTNQYSEYCGEHDLPAMSADELLHEMFARRDAIAAHVKWLSDFILRWEVAQEEERETDNADMSFAQFQATRVWTDDLSKSVENFIENEDARKPACGNVYLGGLYIEHAGENWTDEARARGQWYLMICNEQYISDDLESLERKLYRFAVGFGWGETFAEKEGGK